MEILDTQLDTSDQNQPSLTNWLPFVILWGGIVYCIVQGLITNWQVVVAGIVLLVSTIIGLRNFPLGAKILLFILLAAMLEIIQFFPFQFSFGIGITDYFLLGAELISLGVLILHYFSNKAIIKPYIKSLIDNPNHDSEVENNNRIQKFKEKYANHSSSELSQIANNEKMIPAARQAAKALLLEK